MKVADAIDRGDRELRDRSTSPRLDGELLLATLLQTDRAGLYQRLDARVASATLKRYRQLLQLRQRGYPMAYLLGQQEFFGLPFRVDPRTLIPRPQTEAVVAETIRQVGQQSQHVVDIGTGSGAIAISLAHALPSATIAASDISAAALEVARDNAERLGVGYRIHWRTGALLEPWPNTDFDVAVANLPYLTTAMMVEPSIQQEPPLALHGGADGLRVLETFVTSLDRRRDVQTVLLESLPEQIETISYWLRHLPTRPFTAEPLRYFGQAAGIIGRRPHA